MWMLLAKYVGAVGGVSMWWQCRWVAEVRG